MLIVDTKLRELEEKGTPIRVAMVGAGFSGRGFANRVIKDSIGMKLVAISNRTLEKAGNIYKEYGLDFAEASSQQDFDKNLADGKYVITQNFELLCKSQNVDVVVELTGDIEFGSRVCMAAIENRKCAITLSAELDATLGPILGKKAKDNGVVYSQADGDQPGVIMNLYRWVKFLGLKPVMAGNIKSLLDLRRTPETQKAFAEKAGISPYMATSFADNTKISFEMATVSNATGFPVGKRGMFGPKASHVDEAVSLFDKEQMLKEGLTDYIIGAQPAFGIFVIGYTEDPIKQKYLKNYKMGDGPFYTFYAHTHLCQLEAPLSVARAFLFGDICVDSTNGPVSEVITMAKFDLKKGTVLDGIGGFTCYGSIDRYATSKKENLLPMGLSLGCVLKKDIAQDQAITYDDVELPQGRFADKLREQQNEYFN